MTMTENQLKAIETLKAMPDIYISPDLIAKVEGKNPDVLRKLVKDGKFKKGDPDIYNTRIKFNRKKYLQDIHELPPDQPERTMIQAIDDLREDLHDIGLILLAQLSIGPLLRLDELKQKEKDRQLLQQPTAERGATMKNTNIYSTTINGRRARILTGCSRLTSRTTSPLPTGWS